MIFFTWILGTSPRMTERRGRKRKCYFPVAKDMGCFMMATVFESEEAR